MLLLFAAPAQASTIEARSLTDPDDDEVTTYYVLTPAPGEGNAITVERRDGGLRVTDTGAPLSGCPAVSATAVQCARDDHIIVLTGDGDDSVTGDDAVSQITGGPGNDRLTTTARNGQVALNGEAGDDVLTGGPGGDSLIGGPGVDVVTGGGGDDNVFESFDDASNDTLDGGPDRDTLFYGDRMEPVSVDLAAGVGGQGTERDALRGFENVTGGKARDVLRGDDGSNSLTGFFDTSTTGDLLDGRGGDDRLQGGSGADELIGGAGADTIIAFEGADRIRSGPGRDVISIPGPADIRCGGATDRVILAGVPGPVLHADCERVRTPGALLRLRHERSALRVTVAPRKDCPLRLNGRRTRAGTIALAPGTPAISVRCGTRYVATAFRLTS